MIGLYRIFSKSYFDEKGRIINKRNVYFVQMSLLVLMIDPGLF